MKSPFIAYLKENYFNFEGRASSSEYWHFNAQIVIHLILAFVLFAFCESILFRLGNPSLGYPVMTFLALPAIALASLILFLPLLALPVRRMHDLNLSGWWLLPPVVLSAVVGLPEWLYAIGLFLFLVRTGNVGPNKFGLPSDFDAMAYRPTVQQIWQDRAALRIPVAACLAALLYFSFYHPVSIFAPIDRADGTTEFSLVDHEKDEHWAIVLPTDKEVTRPDSRLSPWPNVGGRRPTTPPNRTLFTDFSRQELGLDGENTNVLRLHLDADQRLREASGLGSKHRKRCRRDEEVSPGVFRMQDISRDEAEIEYENSYSSRSFDEYYEDWVVNACLGENGIYTALYTVMDDNGHAIAYGQCFADNNKCKFSVWLPFERRAHYTIEEIDVRDIRAMHTGVVRYLIEATDRKNTFGVTVPELITVETEPFDPARFIPSPSFSSATLDPSAIPASGFHQVFFDGTAPDTVVHRSNTPKLALNSGTQGPYGISADQIAGYWVGKRTFAVPTRQMIALDVSNALTIVRINGKTVYQYRVKPITGAGFQDALDNPLFDNSTIKLSEVSLGRRPENPFFVNFLAGENIIEVEYINDHHTIDMGVRISDEITPVTRNAVKDRMTSSGLQDAPVFYVGVYDSALSHGRITVNLPATNRPTVLVLDSHENISWQVDTAANIAMTVVSSQSRATHLTGEGFGEVVYLNKPIGLRNETRDCKCERSRFRCSSKSDVNDIAVGVVNLTGSQLAGYATSHNAGLIITTEPYTPSVEERIRQLREDYTAIESACS